MAMLAPSMPEHEAELVATLLERPPARWRGAYVATEVRTHGTAKADLIVMTPRRMVSIEVKRRAWQRAIGQAVLNRYVFDRSYIALWVTAVNDRVLANAGDWGVGVIAISAASSRIVQEGVLCQPHADLQARVRDRVVGRSVSLP